MKQNQTEEVFSELIRKEAVYQSDLLRRQGEEKREEISEQARNRFERMLSHRRKKLSLPEIRFPKRIAAGLAIALIIMALLPTAVYADGIQFSALIRRVFSDHTEFRVESAEEDGGKDARFVVSYIPFGYRKTADLSQKNAMILQYRNTDGQEFSIHALPAGSIVAVDTEHAEERTISIGGKEGQIFEKNGWTVILRTIEDYLIMVEGSAPKQELQWIAEGIHIK